MEYVKWTDDEWQAVAKRAKALKDSNAEMSWTQIALVSQDEIKPERRRFSFNKLSVLKPVFDILGLDENGNVKPPPPPPPAPVLPPAPATVGIVVETADAPPQPLDKGVPVTSELITKWQRAAHAIPVSILIEEVFGRAEGMRLTAKAILETKGEVDAAIKLNNETLQGYVDRVDHVEKMILDCMEGMDKVVKCSSDVDEKARIFDVKHKEVTGMLNLILDKMGLLSKDAAMRLGEDMVLHLEGSNERVRQASSSIRREADVRQESTIAPVRFLLIGLHTKDIQHIKEKLPRRMNVELVCHDNSERTPLPSNVHYCLVTGHAEYFGRWQRALGVFGERALRMENGSVATFAKRIESLVLTHQAMKPVAVAGNGAK